MKRYRKSLLTFDGLYYVNTDLKFSGYAAYDVQWIRIEQKWYYRHILFDLINRMPTSLFKATSLLSSTMSSLELSLILFKFNFILLPYIELIGLSSDIISPKKQ